MSRSRGWVFTSYNLDENFVEQLNNVDAQYIIAGKEKCPTTDRVHIQGFIYWPTLKSFKQMKQAVGDQPYIHVANGSVAQNRAYCTKDEDIVIEKGEMPMQGRRKDIDHIREIIEDGGNMRDVCGAARGLQSIRVGEKLLEYTERTRNWKPTVKWFWGETGTGKTREAAEQLPNAWWSGKTLKWWQGYDAHEEVIIDDFRGDFCTFHELLRILDRYPYTIEVKGGSRQLLAKTIIITSCHSPENVYSVNREKIDQLLRRIDVVSHFENEV